MTSEIRPITERQPFSEAELNILKSIRERKIFYAFTTYLAFIALLISVYFYAKSQWQDYDEEEQLRFVKLAPYVFSLFFVGLTIFFINYYYRLVQPYAKDIKEGIKEIIYFKPEPYKTPFFAEYYIVTPLKNKRRIKVSAEIFQSIQNTGIASITRAPHSSFVFEVDVGKNEMTFNETNEPLDI